MAKRRAVADSDDENASQPASKRSRTTESDEEEQPHAPRATKGKKAAANEAMELDEDEEGGVAEIQPDDAAEKKFEEENEELIRERLMSKSKTQGVSTVQCGRDAYVRAGLLGWY